jgi:glycosyltransferase involved in cell wall biosynthesis
VIRLLHLVPTLAEGGVEHTLLRISTRLDRAKYFAEVVTMSDRGALRSEARDSGLPVLTLGMRPGVPNPLAVLRLIRLIRRRKPAIVHCWMYHASLLSAVVAPFVPHVRFVWSIHHTRLAPHTKYLTRVAVHAAGALSKFVPSVMCCPAKSVFTEHVRIGYDPGKMVILPNGFDTQLFAPRPDLRAEVRSEIGVPRPAPAVCMVARFNPDKDHRTFVQAAAQLSRSYPDACYILCGDGIDWSNATLVAWIREAGLVSHFRLLGPRKDIWRIFPAVDIATLSSLTEAFPNVLGEAMACGTCCVSTAVGDAPELIAGTGIAVPPRDPGALAAAWAAVLSMPPEEAARRGSLARARIQSEFDIDGVVRRYELMYDQLASPNSPGSRTSSLSGSVAPW